VSVEAMARESLIDKTALGTACESAVPKADSQIEDSRAITSPIAELLAPSRLGVKAVPLRASASKQVAVVLLRFFAVQCSAVSRLLPFCDTAVRRSAS
jgi:hypothetical protein